jgi:hypothetical protein
MSIFSFFSCKRNTALRFNTIVVEKQIPLIHENDSTLPFAEVKVRFTYPTQFRDVQSLARLQQIFVGTFFDSVSFDSMTPQEAMNQYIAEYTEMYQSLSNDFYNERMRLGGPIPQWYWYTMSNINKILFQNDFLLSYSVEFSDYTGGAHGSFRVINYNIDLTHLVTISEEDLFIPNFYKPLTEKIINALMKQFEINEPDMLLEKGFFTLEDIVPNSNFWLDNEGMHYSFNQYEIAPYMMGVINVTIPFSELRDILLPESIISRHLLND